MKKEKVKHFQMSKEEHLEIKLLNSEFTNARMIYEQKTKAIFFAFCKRVNEKPENIIADPRGGIYVDPNGMVSFKEK